MTKENGNRLPVQEVFSSFEDMSHWLNEPVLGEVSQDVEINDSMGVYLAQMRNITLLRPEQEKRLGLMVQRGLTKGNGNGDPDRLTPEAKVARNELVWRNLPLVVSVAKRYQNRLGMLEMIQTGNERLIELALRFDPNKGRFSTWLRTRLEQSMVRRIDKYDYDRGSANWTVLNDRRSIYWAIQSLTQTKRRDPTPEEVYHEVDGRMSMKRIENCMGLETSTIRLSANEDGTGWMRTVASGVSVDKEITRRETSVELGNAIEELKQKEKTIVMLRIYDEMTFEEIGRYVGLTRAGASYTFKSVMKRLRKKLSNEIEY